TLTLKPTTEFVFRYQTTSWRKYQVLKGDCFFNTSDNTLCSRQIMIFQCKKGSWHIKARHSPDRCFEIKKCGVSNRGYDIVAEPSHRLGFMDDDGSSGFFHR